MAYQKGSDMLLQCDTNGSGSYSTVAAIQTTTLRLNSDTVEVTNQGSPNKFRQLLAGAGIKRLSISGQGVFDDSAVENTMLTYARDGTIRNWRVTVPTLGTFTANFQVTQIEYAGRHQGEVQWSMSLESAGDLTYAAA